jgi:hypothetical protein
VTVPFEPVTIERGTVAVFGVGEVESVTLTVKLEVPTLCDFPDITPVVALSKNPLGKLPAEIDHVYGIVPPAPVMLSKYDWPTVPLGSDVVVIASGATAAPL